MNISPAQPARPSLLQAVDAFSRDFKPSKFTLGCTTCAVMNRRIAIFGDRTILSWRAVDFSCVVQRRFFAADSNHPIDVDGSTDRGASKVSKSTLGCTTFACFLISVLPSLPRAAITARLMRVRSCSQVFVESIPVLVESLGRKERAPPFHHSSER